MIFQYFFYLFLFLRQRKGHGNNIATFTLTLLSSACNNRHSKVTVYCVVGLFFLLAKQRLVSKYQCIRGFWGEVVDSFPLADVKCHFHLSNIISRYDENLHWTTIIVIPQKLVTERLFRIVLNVTFIALNSIPDADKITMEISLLISVLMNCFLSGGNITRKGGCEAIVMKLYRLLYFADKLRIFQRMPIVSIFSLLTLSYFDWYISAVCHVYIHVYIRNILYKSGLCHRNSVNTN